MTHEDARAYVERVTEAIARQDVAALLRDYAPDCVIESPTAGGETSGLAAIEQVFRTWFTAFPDLRMTAEKIIVDDGEVVVVSMLSGTDHGGFMNLPPSHKPFRIPLVSIYTMRDGLVVRERRILEFTGFLVQIGVLKARPA